MVVFSTSPSTDSTTVVVRLPGFRDFARNDVLGGRVVKRRGNTRSAHTLWGLTDHVTLDAIPHRFIGNGVVG